MTKENWTDIHSSFAEKWLTGKTYQQKWEEEGITHSEAKVFLQVGFELDNYDYIKKWKEVGINSQQVQEWISAGFKPRDYDEIKEWKDSNFTSQEIKSWIDVGLDKRDAEFATYLRGKNIQPSPDLNLWQLKKEFHTAQNYLDCFYPLEQRKTVKELHIEWKKLTGSLDLNDFVELEELHCKSNKLTSLNLANCLKLKRIYCSNNLLTGLDLSQNNKLEVLVVDRNNFSEQDLSFLSHLVNLEILDLCVNRFVGSLESLKNMTKLDLLDISGTSINSGLECLPESVKYFDCSSSGKVRGIYDLFKNEQGIVENFSISRHGLGYSCIKNFLQKLQEYKQKKDPSYQIFKDESTIKREETEKIFRNAQEWLNETYANKESTTEIEKMTMLAQDEVLENFFQNLLSKRTSKSKEKQSTEKNEDKKELEGELIIDGYPQLTSILLKNNKLTELTITNCPLLEKICIENNNISELEIHNCLKVTFLNCSKNKLFDLNIRNLTELQTLFANDNKLKKIDISQNTKLVEINFKLNPWEEGSFPLESLNRKLEKKDKKQSTELQKEFSFPQTNIINSQPDDSASQSKEEVTKWDDIKTNLEIEKDINRLTEKGYWDREIQTLPDDRLPSNKKQITLQTQRRNWFEQLKNKQEQQLWTQIEITPKK